MPSSEEYLNKCLKLIDGVGFIATRPIMGDYIIYVEDRPIGGIYEDRLFLTACDASENGFPEAELKAPYVGSGEMLLIPECAAPDRLREVISKMIEEIPIPKACRRFSH